MTILVNTYILTVMAQHPYKKKKKDGIEAQIIQMYKAGNSFRKIAEVLKVSHETVRQIWLSVTVDKIA